MRSLIFTLFFVLTAYGLNAQTESDSTNVVNTLEELFTVCNSSGPEGEGVGEIVFDRVAPHIVYRGENALQRWKVACDYNKAEDRKHVDLIGNRIKKWLDEIDSYQVLKYMTDKESEGEWHVVAVMFKKGNVEKEKAFAFLKIGDSYLLGDID